MADRGKQPHGSLIFGRGGVAVNPAHDLGEANAEHGLLGAIPRKKPAIDVLIPLLVYKPGSALASAENAVWGGAYVGRRVRIVAHQEHGVDLGERERARQQGLPERHADLLVDLAVHRGAAEVLAICYSVQAAHAVQEGRGLALVSSSD